MISGQEFEFCILHLETSLQTQAGFTVYRVKVDGTPHPPGDLGKVCVFLLGMPRGPGQAVAWTTPPILILPHRPTSPEGAVLTQPTSTGEGGGKKPDSSSVCCGQPRAGGDRQVLREWRGTYVYYTC